MSDSKSHDGTVTLSAQEAQVVRSIIEIGQIRGAWRMEELSVVLEIWTKLKPPTAGKKIDAE